MAVLKRYASAPVPPSSHLLRFVASCAWNSRRRACRSCCQVCLNLAPWCRFNYDPRAASRDIASLVTPSKKMLPL
jgi:hypothetical protein